MNSQEFKCVSVLTDLVENHGLVGVKTSFEDEGASFNDTIRLKEVCNQSNTKLTIKIGGPEAIRDINDSIIIGVRGIVAPMVESEFGLYKFIGAVHNNLGSDVISSLQLNINIETVTGINNASNIINSKEISSLYGITIGRVDLVSSLGKDRDYVNSDEVYSMVSRVFSKAKERGLKLCLGGAISLDSSEFLQKLSSDGLIDKFETRYAIYDASVALSNLPRALSKGQMFEYEWLKHKKEHYSFLCNKDSQRISMIQDRINQSIGL